MRPLAAPSRWTAPVCRSAAREGKAPPSMDSRAAGPEGTGGASRLMESAARWMLVAAVDCDAEQMTEREREIWWRKTRQKKMAGAIAYEEQRRMQVEENKRKLEELNLRHLSAALRDAAPKSSPVKSVKRKPRGPPAGDAPPRRSGRVASLPEQPKYRYEDTYHVLETKIRKRGSRTHSTRSDLINRVYATEDARAHAITMAQELQDRLDSSHPSFVKPMTQSHVTGGFWLGLPKQFCTKHLPKRDEWITLVDEEEVESESYYLALKWGLSARWKAFAIDHKLVDGDCLVFELIQWAKFKVHIMRQSSYYE